MDKKISVENSIKNYSDKKFNFILDEDSHSLYELGTKTFWLKTQTLNFEGIKSSLNDFDCSISYSKPTFPDSYVKALYFDGTGFISSKNNTGEGDVLVFSESMNCIIGGRGSGKTTLLNSLNLLISQLVDSSSSLKNALSQGYLCMLYRHEKEVEWQQ
ncbi:hypothetical protein [Brochothrix campestris]|nr:hypothetical protein [Brochothrix campestris]